MWESKKAKERREYRRKQKAGEVETKPHDVKRAERVWWVALLALFIGS